MAVFVVAAGMSIGIAVGMIFSVGCKDGVNMALSAGTSVSRDSSASSYKLSQSKGPRSRGNSVGRTVGRPKGADQSVGDSVTADCSIDDTLDAGCKNRK